MLIFFWRGSRQANVHQCSEVTVDLLPSPPLSIWWVFFVMGISSPRHYPFISKWSLHWLFPPLQLLFPHPYNFTTLNYKQVINLVDPPVSDFCVVSRTRPGKIDWVSGFLGQHSPLCSFCPSGVHPFRSPYHLDFDLVTNMRLQLPNYWRRRSKIEILKGVLREKNNKLMVKRRFSFSGKSQNCLNCCKAISWF